MLWGRRRGRIRNYTEMRDRWGKRVVEVCWNGHIADVGNVRVGRIICAMIRKGKRYIIWEHASVPGTNGRKDWPLIVPLY